MTTWAAGGIGAVSALAGGAFGFLVCRLRVPRERGGLIDGGAILGILFGFPIGYALGLTAGLIGAWRIGGPYGPLPAIGLGLLPFALLVASLFVFRKRR